MVGQGIEQGGHRGGKGNLETDVEEKEDRVLKGIEGNEGWQ